MYPESIPWVALNVPDTILTASRAGEYEENFSTHLRVLGVVRM